jgi:hypothetical protein
MISKFYTYTKSFFSIVASISATSDLGAHTKTIPLAMNLVDSSFSCWKSLRVCPFLPQSMLMKTASISSAIAAKF